jgi:hypothetical protein
LRPEGINFSIRPEVFRAKVISAPSCVTRVVAGPQRMHDTLPARSSLFPCYASKLTLAEKNLEEKEEENVLAFALVSSIVTAKVREEDAES